MALPTSVAVLSNISVIGNQAAVNWPGGAGVISVAGTLTGCTLTLQFLGPDGSTWINVTGVSLTAAGYAAFSLPPASIRAVLTSGSCAGVYATAAVVPTILQ